MLQNIFQLNIWNINLSLDLDQIKKEVNTIVKSDKGRVISNQGGYQSNNIEIEKFVHLSFLKEIILNNTIQYKQSLGLKTECKLDNLWININNFKDFNISHMHPNSSISGVFYIECLKESGQIVFENPFRDHLGYTWDSRLTVYNPNTSSKWKIVPETNKLLLFPSFLNHYVEPNLSKDKRISISFNVL
tara:strand:- start:672 stop:1238 length:567 start_codon:yes stop_codon:yes gene_type:complete